MDSGRFSLALAAGMLATVNPCGLPMLPAYLSFFLTADDDDRPTPFVAVLRALGVAGVVSLGFLAVFAVAGMVVSWISRVVYEITPWITVVVGIGLVVMGVLLLLGRNVTVVLPKLDKGGRTRTIGSMFLFGVSYAVASISCTLPVFLSVVGTTIGSDPVEGMLTFVVFSAGMALVLAALTVSLALARTGFVTGLRRSLRVIGRVAGGFLVVAGLYIAWYGVYEIRRSTSSDQAVDRVTGWSADLSGWISDLGATRVAGAMVLVIVAVVAVAWARSRGHSDHPAES